MTRPVPACGLALIERFEGLHDGDKRTPVLEPQADPVGIWTCGYGYALFEAGQPCRSRDRAVAIWRARWPGGLTQAMARQLLVEVGQDVCDRLLRLLPGVTLNDHELGALTSLCYNIGVDEVGGAPDFADSTVRRRLIAGDRHGAADAFRMWRMAGGRVLPGLVTRREAERELFLTPMPRLA